MNNFFLKSSINGWDGPAKKDYIYTYFRLQIRLIRVEKKIAKIGFGKINKAAADQCKA